MKKKRTQKDHESSELIACKRTYNEGASEAYRFEVCCLLLYSAFVKFHKKEINTKPELIKLLQAEIELSEIDYIQRLLDSADGNPLRAIEPESILLTFVPTLEDLPTVGDYNDDDMDNDGNMDGNEIIGVAM